MILDVHAHILPGIDDGAQSLEETTAMLEAAKAAGVTDIVTTPHMNRRYHDLQAIYDAYSAVKPLADRYGITLYCGCECNIDMAQRVDAIAPCCFQLPWRKERFLLLELHNDTERETAGLLISQLVQAGISPILAHPERYAFIQEDIHTAADIRAYGGIIQVDASAFAQKPWEKQRRAAQGLLKAGLIDCIASDAHYFAEYDTFSRILHQLKRKRSGFWNFLET